MTATVLSVFLQDPPGRWSEVSTLSCAEYPDGSWLNVEQVIDLLSRGWRPEYDGLLLIFQTDHSCAEPYADPQNCQCQCTVRGA